MGSRRVQVVLDEEERTAFQEQARRESMSLSAWLRAAGRERLAARKSAGFGSTQELLGFFEECSRSEEGSEPDWEQHLAVLAAAQRSGGVP